MAPGTKTDVAGETSRSSRRSSLEDVARVAGVSLATVDRVLNERGSVSAETARRVIETARQLGLRRTLPIPYARRVRIDVLLARSETPFFSRLTQAFVQVAATLDRSVIILRNTVDQSKPTVVAQRIRTTTADGVIVYCEEHPEIVQAIAAAVDAGAPVICLVTDVPDSARFAYVGIDHTKAGRTAGFLAANMVRHAGPALVMSTSLGYRAHKQRLAGFRTALGLHASRLGDAAAATPRLEVAHVAQMHDDPDRAYGLLTSALRQFPDASVVYNTGGANRAVAAAIRDASGAGQILFIGHELTTVTTELLEEGVMTVAIDQAPELQARSSVDLMLNRLGALEAGQVASEIPFTVHTRENA